MTDAWDGRPQNPERDGWHWLMRADGFVAPYRWTARASGFWLYPPDWELMPEDKAIARQTYLGPCLTPAEAEAERDRLRDEVTRLEASLHQWVEDCATHLKTIAALEDRA